MNSNEANNIVSAFINQAQLLGPQDPLTKLAYLINTVFRMVFMLPLLIVTPISTFFLGILTGCTFGILLLPLSFVWLLFFGFLMSTSWLWIHVPILRPLLLIPGVIVAVVADIYCSLIPDMGEKFQKVLKMGFCDSWPYSYIVFQIHRESGISD